MVDLHCQIGQTIAMTKARNFPAAIDHNPHETVALLNAIGITKEEAAKALGIGSRSMRRYTSESCPHHIWMALRHLRHLRTEM